MITLERLILRNSGYILIEQRYSFQGSWLVVILPSGLDDGDDQCAESDKGRIKWNPQSGTLETNSDVLK